MMKMVANTALGFGVLKNAINAINLSSMEDNASIQ